MRAKTQLEKRIFNRGTMPKSYLSKKKDHKRGEHCWVAYCDEKGNELWGYCEVCGKINKPCKHKDGWVLKEEIVLGQDNIEVEVECNSSGCGFRKSLIIDISEGRETCK